MNGNRSTSLKGPDTTVLPYAILPRQEQFVVPYFQLLFSSWQANNDSLSSQSIELDQLAIHWADRLIDHFSLANGVTTCLIDRVGRYLLLIISTGSMMALKDNATNSTLHTTVYVILTDVGRSKTTLSWLLHCTYCALTVFHCVCISPWVSIFFLLRRLSWSLHSGTAIILSFNQHELHQGNQFHGCHHLVRLAIFFFGFWVTILLASHGRQW